jgi:hypothetical protein
MSAPSRAEVGVGAGHPLDHRADRLAGVHVGQRVAGGDQLAEARQQVVALDHPDADAVDAELAGDLEDALAAGPRVQAAGVRQDAHAALLDLRQHPAHEVDEVGGVAQARVLELLPHHDRQGHLGEVVHADVVDGPSPQELHGRVHVVAPEPLAIAHPHRAHEAAA